MSKKSSLHVASGISRRRFLGAAAVLALPAFIPSRVLGLGGETAPSNRITLGLIGCGNMGMNNARAFLELPDCQIVAACDVDKKRLNSAVRDVNKKYATQDCRPYHDFRELLARRDIDAVMVATPDHWHAMVAVDAARAGKDIYGEKPLAHTVAEQQAIVKTVAAQGRIWQTGSWQRSVANFHKAAEIVRNGLIGTVTRVEVGLPRDYNKAEIRHKNEMNPAPVPPELDYDLWVGPSSMMPYVPARLHRDWRWNYNFGGGQLMDWVGHHCDIAHWGLDFDRSGPYEVQGHGDFPPPGGIWNAAKTFRIELEYPRNIHMTMAGGYEEIAGGVKWIGTGGWVHVNRGSFEASNEEWEDWKSLPEELRKVRLYKSTNHQENFLQCVKTRQPTITPAETAHHSAVPGHLGLISMLLNGRKIQWDVSSERIAGDPEATKMLGRDFRSPWKLS
jgi:predicted dehydrogenase